ncbi:NAD(P)-dependent oxidoreductase [Streptomyces sp. NPDC051940]|uniref:NAD-dependent epimerase/dehydratase family protein n=1 Tax=Streptomyces sp. NPDC051940 TaxID=3155675 RepID=UPI0034343D13
MTGRVLVTGAAGRIGRAVLDRLAAEGVEAHALVLQDPGDLPARLTVTGDAASAVAVRHALSGVDAVIHLAAIPTPQRHAPHEVFAVNTLSTFTVLEEAGLAGVRRVALAGSWGATGLPWTADPEPHPAYVPVDAALPAQVADPYGLSKQVDEVTAAAMARRHGMSVVCLRYPYIGGFDERLRAHAAAVEADPAIGARDLWTYLEVRDAARAALLALSVDAPGAHVVHLCAPETLVTHPTADLMARYHPGTEIRRPLPGRTAPVDLSAAEELLGFRAQFVL